MFSLSFPLPGEVRVGSERRGNSDPYFALAAVPRFADLRGCLNATNYVNEIRERGGCSWTELMNGFAFPKLILGREQSLCY